ncbi:MAG: hypothetical protein ABSG05_01275 [Candidatus Pacearchaeota archaeon]|jgi:hypothetical protein
MGFWDKVKEVGKTASNEISSFINNVQKRNAKWKGYKELKLKIVGNSSLSELKEICREYGIKEPKLYWVDFYSGKKETLGNPRDLFLNQIIRKMPLDKLIDYGRKKRIPVNEIINEKKKIDEEFGQTTEKGIKEGDFELEMGKQEESEDEFELVLKSIEGFNPGNVRDEKDLEIQLKQWLIAKLGSYNIETQYKTEKGDLDIMINKKYGIELKLIENRKTLENLYGQVLKYIKVLGKDNLAVILLVAEYIHNNDIEEAIKDYENLGARVYILEKGRIKRNRPITKTATISWHR